MVFGMGSLAERQPSRCPHAHTHLSPSSHRPPTSPAAPPHTAPPHTPRHPNPLPQPLPHPQSPHPPTHNEDSSPSPPLPAPTPPSLQPPPGLQYANHPHPTPPRGTHAHNSDEQTMRSSITYIRGGSSTRPTVRTRTRSARACTVGALHAQRNAVGMVEWTSSRSLSKGARGRRRRGAWLRLT